MFYCDNVMRFAKSYLRPYVHAYKSRYRCEIVAGNHDKLFALLLQAPLLQPIGFALLGV